MHDNFEVIIHLYEYIFLQPESAPIKEIDLVQQKTLATQSTTHTHLGAPMGADLAVDGDTSGNFGDHSCTHTVWYGSSDPWWSVPLPGRYLITEVHLYNREGFEERLSPLDVYVQGGITNPKKLLQSGGRSPKTRQFLDTCTTFHISFLLF